MVLLRVSGASHLGFFLFSLILAPRESDFLKSYICRTGMQAELEVIFFFYKRVAARCYSTSVKAGAPLNALG